MKIKKLEIRNALGLKELTLEPGKTTMITGGSEQGKSSILGAIEKTIFNTCSRSKFIRAGENEAMLYMEFDNGVEITRKVRDGKSDTVKVVRDGVPITSPETYLKSLVNGYAFNPVSFIRLCDKDQTDLLLGLIPLAISKDMLAKWLGELPPVNMSEHGLKVLKEAEKYYYSKRTESSRELKTTQTQLDALALQLPVNYNPADWENVSLKETYERITRTEDTKRGIEENQAIINGANDDKTEINEKFTERIERLESNLNADCEKLKRECETERADIKLEISEFKQKIADREARLQSIDKLTETKIAGVGETHTTAKESVERAKAERIKDLENKIIQADTFLRTAINLPDVEALKLEAENIEKMKGFVETYRNVETVKAKLKSLETDTEYFESKIATCRSKPAELLAAMTMPVTGLGINDEAQITVDELPIRNLSTSRQIQLALEIARETSGDLKLICIDQFEALDNDRQAEFLKATDGDDFIYFITKVTNGELSIETDNIDKEMSA